MSPTNSFAQISRKISPASLSSCASPSSTPEPVTRYPTPPSTSGTATPSVSIPATQRPIWVLPPADSVPRPALAAARVANHPTSILATKALPGSRLLISLLEEDLVDLLA